MPLKNYNVPPYYDDFDPTKNYLRVLFRPGYAVQARELTQLQTAIQAQIERFGNHVFKNGSRVLGGQIALDTKYDFIKLEKNFEYDGDDYYPEGDGDSNLPYYSSAVGHTLRLVSDTGSTGILATILEFIPSSSSDQYLTAYVRYTQADEGDHLFTAEAVLVSTTTAGYKFKVLPSVDNPVGYGSKVSINEGVYYVNGNFVYTPESSLVIAKHSEYPSARVVYKISENIVTSVDDATLVDNALGTPNDSAPGAHRYQIALDLAVQPIDLVERTENDIIQLLVVKGGAITARARSEYSELANTLATRTYEESGNYTVRPFRLNIREYFNDGSNGGLYTADQIIAAQGFTGPSAQGQAASYGDARLAVGLEPAVAYVNGYRIETLDTTYVELLKARDEAAASNSVTSCQLGGYVYITNLVGMPNIGTYSEIVLQDSGTTQIGTARARGIEYTSGTIGTSGAIYKLYIFDVVMTSGTFADVAHVVDTTVAGYDFSADVSDATQYETATSSLIFKLPTSATNNVTDVIYSVRRTFTVTSSGSNQITLSVTNGSGEVFSSAVAADYVCVRDSNGAVTNATYVSGAGTNSVLLGVGVSSQAFTVVAPLTRTNFVEKTKTLTSVQVNISMPNPTIGAYDSLGVSDALRITAVHMSANLSTAATTGDVDISDRYELDNGQRENFYDVARIRLKPGSSAPTGQIKVMVDHFTHGIGDYFSVNSYDSSLYDLIPSFSSIKGKIELRDAVDFRPTKNNTSTGFTGTGSNTTYTITPGSLFYADLEYYLPRVDKIYVNKNGEFGAQYGISSLRTPVPADPTDSMVLYVLSLNAYTFSSSDVSAKMIDNRRYTMRDIGRLEKRLSNVEYYTSLSLLEKETASKQIMDGVNQRYKNGFVVDSFTGHGIGAITHPDYHCSVDAENGVLRPEFYQDNLALSADMLNVLTTNVVKTGPLITLDYTEVPAIVQPYSSYPEYVNPHAVYGWKGFVKLSPPGDEWKETQTKPAIVANADSQLSWFNSTTASSAPKTLWNDWNSGWYGVTLVNDASGRMVPLNSQPGSVSSIQAQVSGQSTKTGTISTNSGTYNTTTTQTYVDKIVDTAIIPYIRSRKVYFSARGLKPNTRLYAFFDGVNISSYVNPLDTYTEYSSSVDNTSYLDFVPGVSVSLITDSSGNISGSFIIPNNSSIKFLTGNRVFRLIDNILNDTNTAYTYADIVYTAKGILETHQTTIISTVQPVVVNPVKPVTGNGTAYTPPYVTFAVESITPLVNGRTEYYTGSTVLLKGTVWTSGTNSSGVPYSTPIQSVNVFKRSGTVSAEAEAWIPLGAPTCSRTPSSTTFGSFQFELTTTVPSNTPGQYQWKAEASIGGTTYTSPFVTLYFYNPS